MKYKYEFWTDPRNGDLRITLPDDLDVVSEYLETEIRSENSANITLERIDAILSEQNESSDGMGNAYGAEILQRRLVF